MRFFSTQQLHPASVERARRQLVRRALTDPYFWLRSFVKTYDPGSPTPCRSFPQHAFFRHIVDLWLREKILFVAKSSQQMATWLFVALHLWDVMYHPGRFCLFQSSKETKAGFGGGDARESSTRGVVLSLMGRADFVYRNLPDFLQTPMTASRQPPVMKFLLRDPATRQELPSIIMAISSAGDEPRQWTITNALIDEMAFQPEGERGFTAIVPRLTRRARLTVVSTPNGKDFFYAKVHDLL